MRRLSTGVPLCALAVICSLAAPFGAVSAFAQDGAAAAPEAKAEPSDSLRSDGAFAQVASAVAADDPAAVARALRARLDAFARDGYDAEREALLSALVEFGLEGTRSGLPRPTLRRLLLDGLDLPSEAHDLRARLALWTEDAAQLAPLVEWEFVGPFENERGRAMGRRTPPEEQPDGGPYPGKVVEVDWRPLPAPATDGVHQVDRFVYPRVQYAIVARTWVRADDARDVVLALGASEEVRVWLNGTPIFDALGIHGFAYDSHGVPLALDAGWNEIALKVGAQDGSCMFSARLLDPESAAPVALQTSARAPGGVEPKELANPGRRVKKPLEVTMPGALAALGERDDVTGLVARAALQSAALADPLKERPGFELARRAHELAPADLAAALLHLRLVRVPGALDVEEDVNPYLAVLRSAIDRHGDQVLLMHAYADHAEIDQGLEERAHEFRMRAYLANLTSVTARSAFILSLADRGLRVVADPLVDALVADQVLGDRPDVAAALANWFDPTEPEFEALLRIAAEGGNVDARERIEDLTLPEDDAAQRAHIEADLEEALAKDPSDISIRLWAGRLRLALGDVPAAIASFDEAVALSPDDPVLNGWRARALIADGDFAGAADALQRVLELDLSNTEEQRLLGFVQGELARGDGVERIAGTEFQDRFAEPLADIVARHPAEDAPAADAVGDAPREVLLERLVVDVGPDGTARRYRRSVQRILGPAGVKDLDRNVFRAYPGQEEIRVLRAEVLRADGSVARAQTGRTGGRGYFVVDLPPLAIGDVVDIEWRHDDLRPSIFGNYFGLDAPFVRDPSLPVDESEVVVLQRTGVDLTFNLAGGADASAADRVELEDGTVQHTFELADFRPRRSEVYEPPAAETLARVQASTYANWQDFGRWWWNLIREEVTSSAEMREKVAELTAGKETKLEKLRAIYNFVVTDIRYNAWEFGIHGYQPYSAPVIFSRRFGDCKDKAILMKAMLDEVGIEAWPVVIKSDGRRMEEDLTLALIGHFNHCIAYIPEQEGIDEMFLDGTARLHPLEVLPDSDRGARVLVVRDDGVELKEIPFANADTNRISDEMLVDLTGPDGPVVTMTRRPKGRWDPRERMRFDGDDKERAKSVERMMTSIFGALRAEATAVHPDYQDIDTPLEIRFEAAPKDIGRGTAAGRELPVTFADQGFLTSIARETERETDLLLDVPWSSEQTIEYVLPRGTSVDHLPSSLSFAGEDLEYAREVGAPTSDPDGNVRLRIVERLALPNHRIPVERYGEFRALARRVDEAQRETLDTRTENR